MNEVKTGTEACIMTGQVDWKLLRIQKQILLDLVDGKKDCAKLDTKQLAGLVDFLDVIQDQAVKQLGEDIVFCNYLD